ncbi:Cullin family-domain-containing protein [Schizothecium vesticola]|uniref:Cullin family-domain-containing protein n=1 Tax=Schizothecium vesticola TaxID=314040 RepID=A0AA40BPX0_9PEZI|nr:Cullin family-domain-containing protein [Schizothecium vesticola]
MSTKAQGKRPAETIDLTSDPHYAATGAGGGRGGISLLRPHMGPRKVVIKNLRVAGAPTATDEYFSRTREELDEALAAVFAGRPTPRPLERLYRGVEDLCRRGEGEPKALAGRLKERCEAFLSGDMMAGVLEKGGTAAGDQQGCLREVVGCWRRWSKMLVVLRWIYSYLDRSYLLLKKPAQGVNEMGVELFRKVVFGGRKSGEVPVLGARVLMAVCELVEFDRRRDGRFDTGLLKEAVLMLRSLGVYGKLFEVRFLAESYKYFVEFAAEWSVNCGLKDYITASDRLLQREAERCDMYNFDSTTKRELRETAQRLLTVEYSEKLLDKGSVAKLLDAHDVDSMRALYELLRQSGIQKGLKGPWEEYIRTTGAAIVSDQARAGDMIVRLLELRRSLDIMIRDAFDKDDVFTYGLREAFGSFINEEKTSKVGEMLAKYIDMLLRGGLKTLPKTLLSDTRDRADAEMSGIASTADEDAELDRQLDNGLELFRFIEGKDVFEAFYKRDLARRLLMGRSASQDAERNMLTKLKSECGSQFTHNLEQMFRDQELGRDEMAAYKQWLVGTGKANRPVDLHVSILSSAAWPTYPDVRVLLPRDVLEQINTFDNYYKTQHSGRVLTWKHPLAHAVVRAHFDKGPKDLLVSAFQAVVLVLFNDAPAAVLSHEQIAQSTGLPPAELERTLQSLACGKARILTKHPRGRDVKPTDTFSVNRGFWDPKFRVKVNQIQLRETKADNAETYQRVAADRQFETQAAIVRIMKARKTMAHAQLVAEVISQTKGRGAVEPAEIKVNIEKLIEKDYIEREDGNYVYLA